MTFTETNVREFQTWLKALGLYTGIIDGRVGPLTLKAASSVMDALEGPITLDNAPVVSVPSTGYFSGIVDVNHNNPYSVDDLKARGVAAVIHKATEGTGFTDPLYDQRKAVALAKGLLWGAYHFTTGEDGHQQALKFLSVEPGDDSRILLALDFEPSSKGPNMTLAQGRDFIQTVFDKVGRYPVVYGGGGLLRDLLAGHMDPLFAKCPLWLADYRTVGQTIASTWPEWTLWQYHEDQDRGGLDWNRFRGSETDLRAAWPLTHAVTTT